MKKHFTLLTFFMLLTVFGLQAQNKVISGKIIDTSGEIMPGVTIIQKGTANGTAADIDGKYSLSVPEGATLVFSFIGYSSIEKTIGSSNIIDVTMKIDESELDEIVVIGYGSQKKSDLTGAVGSASGEKLQERPTSSLPQALSGKIAGANVSQNSGKPGGKTQIRIRGNTSVSLDNSPLYVVDGVILVSTSLSDNSSPIDYINSNDIQSVEVLKDASATAIYGSRGANGVVLVTTKRGSTSGVKIGYDSYYGVGKIAKKVGVLNSEEFLMIEDVAFQNAEKYDAVGWANGKYKDPALKRTNPLLFDAEGNPLYDTDWQDEVTQSAFSQNHQLSFTGGSEAGSFGAFLGYTGEEGIMKESSLDRYSARFVFDTNYKKWFKVGGSLGYNQQNERLIHDSWVGRNMIEAIPIIPVKYDDGSWASNLDYPGMEGGPNPVQVGQEYLKYLKTNTVLGNVFVNFTLADGLEMRSSVGVNYIHQKTQEYAGRTLNFIGTPTNGYAQIFTNEFFSWQFENYLTYNKTFADIHSFTGLLGISWQQTDRSNYNVRVNNFSDDFFSFNNLAAGSVPVPPTSSASVEGINSYFGRINYGLKDKYLMTVTGRIDGSSKFGENNRYAFFPSAALAWRVSEEGFLSGSTLISNLKVRSSYGETGNSGIPAYGALAGLSSSYSYVYGGSVVKGIGKGSLANPELKWERTKQIDAGFELGLFNQRISIEADVYLKETTDMLLNAPVPLSSGYATVFRNIGSMENKGLELSLNTVNIENENFSWETMFNISMNKNEVTALSGGSDIFSGNTIIREGEPVGSFWGWQHLGTWGSDEADEAAVYNWLPGDIKLRDVNEDGSINDADKVIIGNGMPKGYGSFINTINYKNFEFSLDLQFTYGNDVMYLTTRPQENRQGIANSLSTVLNAWTLDNQDTEIAQWRPVSAGYDNRDTDHMIQDGSFIRGRNMLLAYNFSSALLDKIHLQRLRVYTSLQNFFLITKYQGYDPEAQTSNTPFGQGEVNFNQYPRPKVIMVGLNVSF
ncbi:TonB-linked SusC/RagA family outer membrane protein [Algoriphagus ratkowskyi]|uniref:TonB-dependent receptor n=1 Tax=Algoriphagus ratkowskyi TaxID=57028 RepID=A0A2W7QWV2_9BACT|nr:TonB-dependent receptor [Algoriphagus ratkowskyi]PZX53053.1 TonB-linked SusC/RagA family outer membrane protein [Algoriphagus ratkowskyi]TXD76335.1 TonB-dependent receptor [Algoriphagus ratkowskyi]